MQKGLSTAAPGQAIDAARRGPVASGARGGMFATWPGRLLALGLAALVVGGAVVAQRVTTPPARAELRTTPVTRGAVTQTVAVSGSVNAAASVRLNFKSAGKLSDILVVVGQQVAKDQVLARLDTSDLQIALNQASANLASAQAKYDQVTAGASAEDVAVAKQSVDNAKKTLDETQRTIANDLAASQQAFTKLKSSYASAQTGFTTLTNGVKSDVDTYTTAIESARVIVAAAVADLTTKSTADLTTARTGLAQADGALVNAQSYATNQLATTLTEWTSARDNVITAWLAFDGAIQRGTDSSGAASNYQSAQLTYATAVNRLTTALDSTATAIASAATNVTSAQNALNTSTSKSDHDLDLERADLVGLQTALTSESQTATTLKSKLTQATTNLATITDAISGGYVSAQQSITTTQEKNVSSVQGAQNTYDAALASYQKTSAAPKSYDIASAYASILVQQAAVDTANNNLANATLKAPVGGVVASVNAQVGEFVSGGGTANAFIVIANTTTIALHGTVGEADVAKLKLGQVATITVDAVGASARMTGKVTSLDPVATIQQGVPVYGVDVTLDIPNPQVRPGMSGTANVIVASRQDVLTVPNLAIRSVGGRRTVQILRDGQPVDVDVTFGISNDTVTEVTAGLQDGDLVVLPQPRAGASAQPRPGGFPGGGGGQPVIVGR